MVMPKFCLMALTAGVIDDFYLDREKILWDWPELAGRLIEEYR